MDEKRIKNWERFPGWESACMHFEQNHAGTLTRLPWGMGRWMYMDHIPGESRLSFLRRCDGAGILTNTGRRELARLEREEARRG